MKILVFDNYDSFTYNLVHLVEKILHQKVDVFRNDQIPLEDVQDYDKIILSPGPGIPEEAGLMLPLIRQYGASKSILGVCLGHQAIGEAYGGKLINLDRVFHGVSTPVRILKSDIEPVPDQQGAILKKTEAGKKEKSLDKSESDMAGMDVLTKEASGDLFKGLPGVIEVGRYHSWIVSDEDFPESLEVTVRDEHGYIMGLRHRVYDVVGVQFHPESVLTPHGEQILRNWLGR